MFFIFGYPVCFSLSCELKTGFLVIVLTGRSFKADCSGDVYILLLYGSFIILYFYCLERNHIFFVTLNKLCFLLSFFLQTSVALVRAKTIVLVGTHQSKLDFWNEIYDEKISQVMLRF